MNKASPLDIEVKGRIVQQIIRKKRYNDPKERGWGFMVFETLTAKLSIVITLGFGALLIVLYPIINKENKYFAWFSLVMGVIILLLLLWFTFGNEVIRHQILKYGLQ